jgi:transcriptional regulator with XRE-family HTH domain
MATTFDDLIRSAESDPRFWMQVALQEYVHSLESMMEARDGMTKAKLAELVGVKAPTVSRWLNGNENLTVESMCRMAFHLGCAVHIHVADMADKGRWKAEPSSATLGALPAKSEAETGSVVNFETRKSSLGFRKVSLFPDALVLRAAG